VQLTQPTDQPTISIVLHTKYVMSDSIQTSARLSHRYKRWINGSQRET